MTWTEPEPRSVAFRTDWEPDPEELRAVRDYLIDPPRWDGEDGWPEHCEGLAAGILQALHVLRGGSVYALPEDETQRYIAQAHAMGKEIERLRAERGDLERDARNASRIFSMDSPIRHGRGGVWHEHDPIGCKECSPRCELTHITAMHYRVDL